MTRDKITTADAVKWFENRQITMPGARAMYDKAIAALRAQLEAEKNEPLTLEELREMDGDPVWAVPLNDEPDWASCWCITNDGCISTGSIKNKNMTHFFYLKDYGVTWLAYRRKPLEHSEV